MLPVRFENETDAARWHLIFMLLSIEKTARFFPEMGLDIEPGDALREIARAFVREYRAIAGSLSLTSDARFSKYQQLIQTTFERLVPEIGEKGAGTLTEWGEHTFQYGTVAGSQAFIWSRLLRRLAGINNLSYPLIHLAVPSRQLEAVKTNVAKHLARHGELEYRIRAAEQESSSTWEEQLNATYTPDASLMDWIENTIEFVNTRKVWQEIRVALNEEQIGLLMAWARRQAEAMEMPPELVKLPNFDDEN